MKLNWSNKASNAPVLYNEALQWYHGAIGEGNSHLVVWQHLLILHMPVMPWDSTNHKLEVACC